MKLYSRKQLFTYIALVLVAFIAVTFKLGFLTLPAAPPQQQKTQDQQDIPASTPFEYNLSPEQLSEVSTEEQFSPEEMENIRIYEKLNDAVVNITTEVMTMNWFLEPVPQEGGSGSGAIIDTRGYILTNKHVVAKAYKVYVTISDGTTFDGKVVGIDYENDLAVVKIEPGDKKLTTITMGDSSALRVGQKAIAIGNPFGYERTLTTGVISGLGRPVMTSSDSKYIIRDMIQTDASVNPGNSGGPLIDSKGRLIGINTMIYSPSGGSVGIGFAVPVNTARRVVPDLIEYGAVQRGWIDVEVIQLFPELVRYANLDVKNGLLISSVSKGSNAQNAGLKGGNTPVRYGRSTFYIGGDVITEINGSRISSISDFYGALENTRIGDTATVKVHRDGKDIIYKIVLSARSDKK